jgi:putative glutamine amidotransferase
MKIVAVSQRVDHFLERKECRDALDHRLVEFLLTGDCFTVPVPNSFLKKTSGQKIVSELSEWLEYITPRAIILSGGNDIGTVPTRDKTESQLLEYANKKQLPVLGICHGMQMIGEWAGTKLHRVDGHVRTRHQLAGAINSEVNSYHGYSLAECPEGFEVLAYSEDGEIEAIRHQSLIWEGWMWHPEREESFSETDIMRLKDLIK